MIMPFKGKWPQIHETSFVAPSADVIGDVTLGASSSVWFQVVIRGDVNWIKIGSRTNIQDLSMLHVTRRTSPLTIGNEVTVAHRVMLHGCTIGDRVLVGMGAIVMDDAVVGDDCIVGAGALVTKGTQVPPGSLVMGAPAKVIRALRPEEIAFLKQSAENYVGDAREYRLAVPGARRLGDDQSDLEDLRDIMDLDDFAPELPDDDLEGLDFNKKKKG